MTKRSRIIREQDMSDAMFETLDRLDRRRLANVAKPASSAASDLKTALDALITEMILRDAMEP